MRYSKLIVTIFVSAFIILSVLKVQGAVNFEWWVVFTPLCAPFVLFGAVAALLFLIDLLDDIFGSIVREIFKKR